MKMKINTDAPEQHMAILAIAGAMIFISVLSSMSKGNRDVPEGVKGSYAETGQSKYRNPQMYWWEKLFCRGYQRSSFCGMRFLHPLRETFEEEGIPIPDGVAPRRTGVFNCRGGDRQCSSFDPGSGPASDRGVLHYGGRAHNNRNLSGRIVVDSSYDTIPDPGNAAAVPARPMINE